MSAGRAVARRKVVSTALPLLPLVAEWGQREVLAGRRDGYLPLRVARPLLGPLLFAQVPTSSVVQPADWAFQEARAVRGTSVHFVAGGTWDTTTASFEDDPRTSAMRDLVDAALDYRSVPQYVRMREDAAAGKPWRWGSLLDTEAAIDDFWRARVRLVRSMQRHGYVRTHGVDDLGVAIGGEGRLLKLSNGNHRLAIARALGLPHVWVRVDAMHVQWVQRWRGGSGARPDLRAAVVGGLLP